MDIDNKTKMVGIVNDEGEHVDLYIPRKCAVTKRVIHAHDKASVQINIAEVFSRLKLG